MMTTATKKAKQAKPKIELTARQEEVMGVITSFRDKRGFTPTIREIGTELGILSPNGVMCHLRALERKGHITREPDISRSIVVLP